MIQKNTSRAFELYQPQLLGSLTKTEIIKTARNWKRNDLSANLKKTEENDFERSGTLTPRSRFNGAPNDTSTDPREYLAQEVITKMSGKFQ